MTVWFVIHTTMCDMPGVENTFRSLEEANAYAKSHESLPQGRPSLIVVEAKLPDNIWGRIFR